MKYLFPPEELRALVVPKITIEDDLPDGNETALTTRGTPRRKRKNHSGETIIFHRAGSQIEKETWISRDAIIEMAGLAVTDSPAFNLFDMATNRRPGLFQFKGSAAMEKVIEIKSTLSLKIIQAGVVLGEAFAKRERGRHRIVTGKNVDRLHHRVACWLLYDRFSSASFLAECRRKNTLPLAEASKAMSKTDYKISPAALEKLWRRLNLPMLKNIRVK